MKTPSCALWVAILAAPTHAANLVVDPSGAFGTFPTPQAAIDAAADGDIILIHAGDYRATQIFVTTIGDRELTLVADPPGANVVLGGLSISGLGASRRVVVRGCEIRPPLFPPNTTVDLKNCAGVVWLEECSLFGATGAAIFNQGLPGEPGLAAKNSVVTLARSTVIGGPGYPGDVFSSPGPGGPAIELESSRIAVHDSLAIGGAGAPFEDGGPAMDIEASVALLSGSAVAGGNGDPNCSLCDGGDGIVADAASGVTLLDSTVAGGLGGSSGQNGAPIVAPPGVVTTIAEAARSFSVTSPAAPGSPITVALEGEPGDTVILFWSPQALSVKVPPAAGWLLIGPFLQGPLVLGPLPAPDGDLVITAPAPPLVPPLAGDVFLAQPVFLGATKAVFGTPSAFVLRQ